jgi:hypothetical protein
MLLPIPLHSLIRCGDRVLDVPIFLVALQRAQIYDDQRLSRFRRLDCTNFLN